MPKGSQDRPQRHRVHRSDIARAVAIAAAVALGATPAAASAADHLVSTSGSDAGTCVSTACHTVAYALGQAASGDRVLVGPGTYNEQVSVGTGKSVVANGASRPLIDGGVGTAVTINGTGVLVQGLRLRGDASAVSTTGVTTTATIADDVFDDTAVNANGKVIIGNGTVAVTGSIFTMPDGSTGTSRAITSTSPKSIDIGDNTFDNFFESVHASSGPSAPALVHDNVITGARGDSPFIGAGMYLTGSATVSENVIGANPTPTGGASGIELRDFSVPATLITHRNRVFGFPSAGIDAEESVAGSTYRSDGDVLTGNHMGFELFGGTPAVTGATVYDNTSFDVYVGNAATPLTLASSAIGPLGITTNGSPCTITFSRGPTTSGTSCQRFQTSDAPGFAGPGDYRLTAGSPLVDAGDPGAPAAGETDVNGTPRAVVGLQAGACTAARRDIGAYELAPSPAFACPPVVVPVVDPAVVADGPVPGATPTPPPVVPEHPPVVAVAAAGLSVLDDAGATLGVTVDGAKPARLRAGTVGRVLALAAGTHTFRLTRPKTKALTARLVLAPGQLGALVVTAAHGRLKVHAVRIAPGARRLLSLVPGALRVRIGTAKPRTLKHGALVAVAPGATTLTGAAKTTLTLGLAAQLTVLVRSHHRVTAVARSA